MVRTLHPLLPHTHIPLLQLNIQRWDLFIHLFCVNTASSNPQICTNTRTHTQILELKKEQAYVNLHVFGNGIHIGLQLTGIHVSVCPCQLESLAVLFSYCTATLRFHSLFKMYFVHRSIFVALFCMKLFFYKDSLNLYIMFVMSYDHFLFLV